VNAIPASKTVAVVVIGRNEGDGLLRCLQSVAEVVHGPSALDIVYVDSDSSDDSVDLVRRIGIRAIALPPGPTTAARGRNAGWKTTEGELVLFLDGDTILHPEFISRAMKEFADPKVAVVWGHRREIAARGTVYNRVLDLDWICKPGLTEFCGGDALIRRDVLAAVGGYDEQLIAGEEPEMCRRMRIAGYQILHIDCPMTGHDLAITHWTQYWKRASRTGFAYASMSHRFRGKESPLWRRDSQQNLVHVSLMLTLAVVTLLASFLVHSWIPLATSFLISLLLTMRTVRHIAWKSPNDRLTCLLYALHSHIQQVPILCGQIKFYRQRDHEQGLIEYKRVAP
jgi:cellulose synthase/poly-beta-1,6-N-acetylglucosamine synthase-like glycosyltransferase